MPLLATFVNELFFSKNGIFFPRKNVVFIFLLFSFELIAYLRNYCCGPLTLNNNLFCIRPSIDLLTISFVLFHFISHQFENFKP